MRVLRFTVHLGRVCVLFPPRARFEEEQTSRLVLAEDARRVLRLVRRDVSVGVVLGLTRTRSVRGQSV